jgi:hypothetical protein
MSRKYYCGEKLRGPAGGEDRPARAQGSSDPGRQNPQVEQ